MSTCLPRCALVLTLVFALSGYVSNAQTPKPLSQVAIPGVIGADARVELIRGEFHRLEGPVSTPDGVVYFSDVDENRTYKLDTEGTITVWRENTKGANGLFAASDGRLLVAERDGPRIIAVTPDRRVTTLAVDCDGAPLRGPNDLILDRKNGIYFTDPGPRYLDGVMPTGTRNVCYRQPNGRVIKLDSSMVYPNGLTLSVDEKTLFVDDTFSQALFAFDVQSDGRLARKREFVKLREPEQWPPWGLRSRADGMALDASGRVYVSTAAGVQVIDATGTHLGIIRVPSLVRNVAFGGHDRHTLYMTALDALYRVQLLSQGPKDRSK